MADFIDSIDEYNKLSEEEFDEKIQEVLKKVELWPYQPQHYFSTS